MSSTILVAGAINTDLVATMQRAPSAGETVTADGFRTFGGGKGANQAVAVARNDAAVCMLGVCGHDANGDARIADLKMVGVQTDWIRIDREYPSGVAMIFVETHGENRIAYVPGATLHVPEEHCLTCFDAIQPSLVLATNELPQSALATLFERAAAADSLVVFNATPDPELSVPLLATVDILIINEGEARALLDVNDAVELDVPTVRHLLEYGPMTIVVTLGSRGALAMTDRVQISVRPPMVDVIDTTGAGDAFCGAFAAAIARGEMLESALSYGVVSGALATTIPGAQASSPNRQMIEQVMRQSDLSEPAG